MYLVSQVGSLAARFINSSRGVPIVSRGVRGPSNAAIVSEVCGYFLDKHVIIAIVDLSQLWISIVRPHKAVMRFVNSEPENDYMRQPASVSPVLLFTWSKLRLT